MHVCRNITGWFDPKLPINRNTYGFAQFVVLVIASALLGQIDSVMLHNRSTASTIFVLFGAILILSLMSILTAKRLLDVGWSRYWTFAMLGPVLMYALLAVGRSNVPLLRLVFIPVVLLFILGGVLIAALFVKSSRSDLG
jgi:uncharacterized membrane protein YhaH (DUF805 family)